MCRSQLWDLDDTCSAGAIDASSRGNNGLPASAFSSGAIIQACLGHKSTVLLERPAWPCLCCSMQRICRPHKPSCP
ncbi:hypothetical protein JOQ06_026400 [Pogonophryne albipinna]|uniref:Uncharacterized protein n=2 Tax=Pogonophryne albipinna TaxID=1090488 RepID=A0AAD6FNX9_9TELE|nr:hypothetical protein JOQ06_026400 [Pogonophryne albipinna]